MAVQEKWSKRELERQFKAALFERVAIQSRKQELSDQLAADQERIELRKQTSASFEFRVGNASFQAADAS